MFVCLFCVQEGRGEDRGEMRERDVCERSVFFEKVERLERGKGEDQGG